MENNNDILGTQPIGKLMIKFALPAVIALLVNSIYNIVDQIFLGHSTAGTLGNGATVIAFPIITISMSAALLFGYGGSAFASIKMGEKRNEDVSKALANSTISIIVFSLLIAIIGLLFLEPLMKLFGATEELLPYAKTYSGITLIGIPFMALSGGLSNFIRADGSPGIAMFSLLAGALINFGLDPLLIFVFDMGVAGAAIATVISQVISAAIVFWYFIKKGKDARLKIKEMRPDFKLIAKIATLGFASCVTQLAIAVITITLNNTLVKYADLSNGFVSGSVAVTSMGVVTKVNGIMIAIVLGIATGAQPILGFNKGAGHIDRVKKTYLLSVGAATFASLLSWGAAVFLSKPIVSLFGRNDPEFVSFASLAMKTYLMFIFVAGYHVVSCNYFQSTGQPLKAAMLTLTRQIFLLVPAILLLPKFFGISGILYAGPVADITAALIVTVFIVIELRKLGKRAPV